MKNSLEQHLRHRLARLDNQIHSSLKVIRQHLTELEKAAGEDSSAVKEPVLPPQRQSRSV